MENVKIVNKTKNMPSMGILIKCAEQLLCSHCDGYINNLLLKLNSKAIGFNIYSITLICNSCLYYTQLQLRKSLTSKIMYRKLLNVSNGVTFSKT